MTSRILIHDVATEVRSYFKPPHTMLNSLFINSLISLAFFLGSYWLGTYNEAFLPIAAATILLWTLADTSVCNQFLFDKAGALRSIQRTGSLRDYLLVKNMSVVVLTLPMSILYGLLLVVIIGKWNELLYGVVASFTLVWGWLGISNALSAHLPYEIMDLKSYMKQRQSWIRYGFVYVLPWMLLPVYAVIMALPFILLGWTTAEASLNHRIVSLSILFALSLTIWWIGLRVADRYTTHNKSKVKRMLASDLQ